MLHVPPLGGSLDGSQLLLFELVVLGHAFVEPLLHFVQLFLALVSQPVLVLLGRLQLNLVVVVALGALLLLGGLLLLVSLGGLAVGLHHGVKHIHSELVDVRLLLRQDCLHVLGGEVGLLGFLEPLFHALGVAVRQLLVDLL